MRPLPNTRSRSRTAVRLRRYLCILVTFVIAGDLAVAQDVPELTGRVVDLADLLSDTSEQHLAEDLAAHEDSTGNQVVVLTIEWLGGEAIEDYSIRVAEAWGLGQAERDNGVLVLVAHANREMRIEVGYGLEDRLTDALAAQIIRDRFIPAFREGDFERGIETGTRAVLEALDGTYAIRLAAEQRAERAFWFGISALILVGGVFFLVLSMALEMGLRIFILILLTPFFALPGGLAVGEAWGAWIGIGLQLVLFLILIQTPWAKRKHKEAAKRARTSGGSSGSSSSWSSGSSGSSSWSSGSSSSSSWSSSSSSSSFSGGGGSFGGGGASGSW